MIYNPNLRRFETDDFAQAVLGLGEDKITVPEAQAPGFYLLIMDRMEKAMIDVGLQEALQRNTGKSHLQEASQHLSQIIDIAKFVKPYVPEEFLKPDHWLDRP